MKPKRGELWWANLNPARGSEQAGSRPVLIFQNDVLNRYTTTVLAIPLTTALRRADLPSCVKVGKGDGNLPNDSVALCHQLRVLDVSRLKERIGVLDQATLEEVETCVEFTLGIV